MIAVERTWRRLGAHLPVLVPNQVHVWTASLEIPEAELRRLENLLGCDERERASRFRLALQRRRFIAAHAILREILATYLGCSARELRFDQNPFGKPFVETFPGSGSPCFNLSHSGDLALYALASDRDVGVDVEQIQPQLTQSWIAGRLFTPEEAALIRALPPDQQSTAFFDFWTRKEATLKAMGLGFSREGLAAIDGKAESEWTARPLKIAVGYSAAVVSKGNDWSVRLFLTRNLERAVSARHANSHRSTR